ncbi:glycoside hydrolase family 20 protein [Macrolepiota fuliginosa MF-IS2]|uniref:Beta-hexosaminidase n=1 Tax=Macrolepiota fuliginosa MF-IS2 TaxID=1400762 RepID=A0A9P6C4A5_9AGAR|nr:glycoside hydrolase family 20 protein [Macrolepiota fuliginosa MF-IS2]
MNLLSLFCVFLCLTPALAIWPRPQNLTTGSTPLRLSSTFSIKFSGINQVPSDLSDAATRTTNFLKTDKLQVLTPDRGASSSSAVHSARTLSSLTLKLNSGATVKSVSSEATQGLGTQDESYSLQVPANGGSAVLSANTALGLFRGLTTFGQLWYDLDGTTYTLQAPIQVMDAPAYPYRGFMLDTSRNYFPVTDIKRTLDAMSWVKINHLHWHVVDSQSFPLVVPGFEEISQKGAYSSSQVYTPANVNDIVSYAAARGIDVMVEIDTPGHTTIISQSHPEHIACPEATPWAQFANEPPAGQLRLASPATTTFTANLIKAASSMFPSKLFSTGGDELNENCYTKDPQTQQDLASQGKTLEQALDTFTQATHSVLLDAGKTPVVWEEMALEHQVQLNNETIVLVWISSDHVAAVAQKGFRLIHAASDFFYLDCGAGDWVGANINGNSWCDPFKTWQKAYSFNPIANLTDDQAKLVLGGQQLLWTEQSGPSNLDPIVWPRAAASAELFWSGPGGDVRAALPRLHDVAYRFVQRGVKAIALQPQWCALRPGACDVDA